jgi:Kef-type K+ transport system membrane component KefB
MKKVSYRFLVPLVLVTALIVYLIPVATGSSPETEEAQEIFNVLVAEKVAIDEEGGELYFVNMAHNYYVGDEVLTHGLTKDDITPGAWLQWKGENVSLTRTDITSLSIADNTTWTLSGTIGYLIKEENETVGFTVNDRTLMLPQDGHSDDHEVHLAVGLGVEVEVEPMEGSVFLQANSIEVIRHHTLLHSMTILMLQISVILFVAKISGEVVERYLKQPAVLGELLAGIVISPYALGGLIPVPGGPLFASVKLSTIMAASPNLPDFAVSPELWAIAQIAAIILLFMAGLETDLSRFLKYAGPATVIGIGGVIVPFVLGIWATVLFIPGMTWGTPAALFMGAVMVATSVGITARVLSDINRLDTSEGVTILAGAVIDDVLGILVLAIVNSIALAKLQGIGIDMAMIGGIALKAILFWLGLTVIGIVTSKSIEKFLNWFRSKGAKFALGLSICFASAAMAEMFGLAMIIGAYSIGLAMSERDIAHSLEEKLTGAYNFVVPIFFVVMGMMVDVSAMVPLFWPYGVVISVFAIISKLFGCGIPALFVGFNKTGAWRIGVGMMPRGEVALIIAGVGIANGIIGTDMFGVAILLTLVTTILAPPLLVPAFQKGGIGTTAGAGEADLKPTPQIDDQPLIILDARSEAHRRMLRTIFIEALQEDGWALIYSNSQEGIYEVTKDEIPVVIRTRVNEEGKHEIAIDSVKGTRAQMRMILYKITGELESDKDHILEKIVETDPNFMRKIARLTSD